MHPFVRDHEAAMLLAQRDPGEFAMQMSDLDPAVLAQIAALRFDWIFDKHDGPWRWAQFMPNVEFMTIAAYEVLLPVPKAHHLKDGCKFHYSTLPRTTGCGRIP